MNSKAAVMVSVSGGKDSTATLLLALESVQRGLIFPVFADTGNEHPMTYEYIRQLSLKLDIEVKTVRSDFTDEWWHRRKYVAENWPKPNPAKGWPEGVPADIVARVLAVMDKGPTGNPFLDLCVIKGRFPSRRAQFCTDFLKKQPLNEYANELVVRFGTVECWQGVRANESTHRATLPERETAAQCLELFSIYRPILRWTVEQVFEQHRKHGIEPNPLYKLGMARVGCMPCINISKDELLSISKRFPEHVDRIAEWERVVADASKRSNATFIPSPEDRGDGKLHDIRNRVEWAKTARGGTQYDMFRMEEETGSCSSRYGLCE